jgi:hypothetical protein
VKRPKYYGGDTKAWLASYHDGKEPKDFALVSADDRKWLE